MKLRWLYIEQRCGNQHDGYEEPILQYFEELIVGGLVTGEWIDVTKVYIDKEPQ